MEGFERSFIEEVSVRNRNMSWFTYRKGFEPLCGTKITTDAGWGCMIRTGQMMLSEALRQHKRVKDIEMFMDVPGAPFGIHSICEEGLKLNKLPGEWYGPQSIMHALHGINKSLKPVSRFKMVVCDDGNIFLDKIQKKINKGNSVFLGVPLRLGIDKITHEYLSSLKQVFNFESNLGIAGG
jgi:cysteine protease ATG4